jgi:hypothetical protein
MAEITVEWMDEQQRILILTMPEAWAVDDLMDAMDRSYNMVESVPHTVYAIADNRLTSKLPDNMISRFPQIAQKTHPRSLKTVFVSSSTGLGDRFFQIFSRMLGRISAASSVEEAYEMLQAELDKHPV